MIFKYLWVIFLGLMIPHSVMAQTAVSLHLLWDPVWEYEDGTPAQQEDLAHFNLYICDSPIVAGGPDADDLRVEPATCVGHLQVIQATEQTADATYTAPHQSGNLYFRVSAVSVHQAESKLSGELTQPYNFPKRLKAPINLRVRD